MAVFAAAAGVLAGFGMAQGTVAQSARTQESSQGSGDDAAERIRSLEDQNASLRRQVADLQAQLDRLRGLDTTVSSDAAPLDPYSSPGALLLELRRRYARQLGDLPRATETQQQRFEQQADRWCEKIRGEIRGRTRWLAAVSDVRVPERGEPDALFRVLDEFTHRPLGEAVRLPITRTIAERFESLRRAHELNYSRSDPSETPDLAFSISTMVLAQPVFNPERVDAGVFNYPPIVGPCVEFGMKLDIDSVGPVELEREKPKPTKRSAPPAELDRPER